MDNCIICHEQVTEIHEAVSCDGCGDWTHLFCGFTDQEYEQIIIGDEELQFQCVLCRPFSEAQLEEEITISADTLLFT